MNILKFSSSALKKLAVVGCLLSGSALSHAQTAKGRTAPTNLQLVNLALSKGSANSRLVKMGDMLLLRKDLVSFRDKLAGQAKGGPTSHIAFGFNVNLWPGGKVPYEYAPDCPEENKPLFEKAFAEWEKYANLKFVPRTNEANYISVFRDPTAIGFSYSALGMVGGAQPLSISEGANTFLVAHEVAHALGCEHEHQRSDRDNYITINFDNVEPDSVDQFTILTDSDNLSTYDFDSIMHYFSTAFAIDYSIPTMICKPGYEQFQDTMGQQDHLSTLDKKGMEEKYPFAALPTFTVDDQSIIEGDEGSAKATFTITLSPVSEKPATVTYETIGDTATAGKDFTSVKGLLTFAAGQTVKKIEVPILGDKLAEANEVFNFKLSGAGGAELADATGKGTILDDDGTPSISIAKTSVLEGNDGSTKANFAVTLSGPTSHKVSVKFNTSDGTATAPADYSAAVSKTINFGVRETTKLISIPIKGDLLNESDETFSVTLSDPTGATLSKQIKAVGTILDDDAAPKIFITGASVKEKDGVKSPLKFTIKLSNPSSLPVTVKYATNKSANLPATAGVDFVAVPQTEVTFAPGETTKVVGVSIIDDTLDEEDEIVAVKLISPTNATIGETTAFGTIIDDDAAPTISVGDASIQEGNSKTSVLRFPVTLSAASSRTVTVQYETADGTALAGEDYTGKALTTLTFNPGQTSKVIEVVVQGDTAVEANETLLVELSEPVNAKLHDSTAKGTIVNDDVELPAISINNVSITEGNSGSKSLTFTVSLSQTTQSTVTVNFATKSGSAKGGSDFEEIAKTRLTFGPGSSTKQVSVKILGDEVIEAAETFTLVLSDAVGATITSGGGVGTIIDNDTPVTPQSAANSLSKA